MNSKPLSSRTCLLLVLLFGIAAYSNTLTGPFQFDDRLSILLNRSLYPFDLGKLWNYSPARFLAHLSFVFNIYLTGFSTWGFHAVNLLIHILTSCIVFGLTRSILNTPSMKDRVPPAHQNLFALVAALLFATHPVQTQAVTYISQRLTSMATLFYLAALWMYLKARLKDTRHYGLVFLFMLAAMLTKEISFTLPFAILLSELFFFPPSAQDPLGKKLIRWMPFAAFLLVIPLLCLMNGYLIERSGGAINILPSMNTNITRWDYLLTQFRVERTYLRLLFFPVDQCIAYDYPLSKGWGDPDTWAAFSLLLSVFILSLAFFKKNRFLTFGVLWFFLTLSVESSLIPIPDLIFEHRLYLSMFGFAIFLTSLLWTALRSAKWFTAVSLVITVVFTGMAYARNKVWQSEIALWQDAAKKSPRLGRVYSGLGDAYNNEKKDNKSAAIYYEKALKLGFINPSVYHYLSIAYSRLKEHKKSLYYQQLASSSPPSMSEKTISFYDNHASSLSEKGRDLDAIDALKKGLLLDPANPRLYMQLGKICHKMQREDEAVSSFQKAIELAPLSKEGYDALALLYNEKGEKQKAVAVLIEYLQFKKKHKPLFGN